MASARPPSDMMFELTWRKYIGMKEATRAIGKARIGIKRRSKMKQESDGHKADDASFFSRRSRCSVLMES